MKSSKSFTLFISVPSNNLVSFAHRAFNCCAAFTLSKHGNRPSSKSPDISEMGKELEGVAIVIVSKVDNAIEMMALDMFKRDVSLMHASVLHLQGAFLANEMTIHNARSPEHVCSFVRSGAHLYYNPKKRRRHKPKCLAEAVEIVELKGAVVTGSHNYEKFGIRRRHSGYLLQLLLGAGWG